MGLRDESALESALMRARNKYHYESDIEFTDLCAAYGYGVSQNHPHNDGNKRTAFAAMMIFARFNGMTIQAQEDSVVRIMYKVASGVAGEETLKVWLEKHLIPYAHS